MRKARILLVDDEVAFTKYLSIFLTNRGHDVTVVHDGMSALEIVEENDFDVIVLDLKMPGIDGIQTLKGLKTRKPSVEVIILTGHGSIDSAIEGVGSGAFDYATKPIVLSELHERITQAAERKFIRDKQHNSR
ncbi:MAG: response regulator [Desulfobacteraceae bacterium]|nr:response regulator [Desulfobacteraceae bacterium]